MVALSKYLTVLLSTMLRDSTLVLRHYAVVVMISRHISVVMVRLKDKRNLSLDLLLNHVRQLMEH